MAIRKFIGGTANVVGIAGGNIVFEAKTLLDATFTVGNSSEDVRGGQGNQLFGKYYHTSTFDVKLTDVMFKLEYFSLVTGSPIGTGSNMLTTETVVINANSGTITGSAFNNKAWVSVIGEDSFQSIDIVNGVFSFAATDGTQVCVKYLYTDADADFIKLSANMIPDEIELYMTVNEFKAGKSDTLDGSSKIGTVEIYVPRYQFNGAMEIGMTASGVANAPLEGSALAVEDLSCTATSGYYAIITEKIIGADAMKEIIAIAIQDGEDIALTVGAKKALICYGIKKSGGSFVIDNSKLTFVSATPATATVSAAGEITGVAAGNTNIDVTATTNPTVGAVATVEVT